MERYIYINYAYEDYQLVQKIIEDIEKTGVKVYHGNGSEERVAGSLCVIHLWTPAAHTSRSYRKIMNYTLKHELDTMLFHLDGAQMASEVEVQLDVLHALFKYKYQMMSRKSADVETKTAVIQNEAEHTEATTVVKADNTTTAAVKQEVKLKPEVVEVQSMGQLREAMADPEPKVIKFNAEPMQKHDKQDGIGEVAAKQTEKTQNTSAEPEMTEGKAEESAEAAKSAAEAPVEKEARMTTENIDETQKKQLQQQETEKTAEQLTTRDALFAEGMRILENGKTREDGVKAFKYLRQAASQGHTEAQYQLSVCYDRGIGVRKSITEAAKWCQMAAFGGHAKAQSEIGYCYEYGQGVVRNIKEAVSWYEMASAQGNIQAKNNLAYCYQKGRGVHKDVKEAIRLYEEAAAGGHASAQYNLGYCYWYGEGVKTDKNRAIELFKQSADNGNAKAAQMLKILSQHLFMK